VEKHSHGGPSSQNSCLPLLLHKNVVKDKIVCEICVNRKKIYQCGRWEKGGRLKPASEAEQYAGGLLGGRGPVIMQARTGLVLRQAKFLGRRG
jgi:hypothetical protein